MDVALARLAEIARDEEDSGRPRWRRCCRRFCCRGGRSAAGGDAVSTVTGNSSCAVEVERLRSMAPALRRRLLRAAARSVGCRISAEETAKLLALAGLGEVQPPVAARPGVRLELAGGLRAERTAREIQLRVDAAPFVAKIRTAEKLAGKRRARSKIENAHALPATDPGRLVDCTLQPILSSNS